MSDGAAVSGVLLVVVIAFLIVLAICWIVLPFAVIGTKPLLLRLIRETKETNKLLRSLGTDYRAAHTDKFAALFASDSSAPDARDANAPEERLAERFQALGHRLVQTADGNWLVKYKSGEEMSFQDEAEVARLIKDIESVRAGN